MSTTGQLRVSDAERSAVADRLLAAHGEGRLTLVEFDERVRAAHAATVRDDLAPLVADLPAGAVPASRPGRPAASGPWTRLPVPPGPPSPPGLPPLPGGPGELRAAAAAWALVSAINVGIWLAVVLGTGAAVYPWWVWVAGPWGLVLAARAVVERSRGARTGVDAGAPTTRH